MLIDDMIMRFSSSFARIISQELISIPFCKRISLALFSRFVFVCFNTSLLYASSLLDIMLSIEGLVNKRSSHASGVIMFDDDPYEFGCVMKTPRGEIITQYDLHMCEAAGMTKYYFLVTEVQDKIVETIHLLQKE